MIKQEQVVTAPKASLATASAMNVLGFIPALVVQHFLKTMNKPRILPESQLFRSVVMFADISGFTNLTEALSKIGNEGAEVIAFAINRYMELLVKGISRSGGDIFKFAGDAMIVIWPPPEVKEGDTISEKEKLQTLLRQAVQSALDIQDSLNDINILEKIKLSVKIGFGIGDINIIYVGGVFQRCEYIATGDPLNQAFESEHHASKGGETIASRDVYDIVSEFFMFQEIIEEHKEGGHKSENGPFYFIKGAVKTKKVALVANALLLMTNLSGSAFENIKPQVMSYIPAALLPYIEIDQEAWSGELRRLSIMFVNLGIDLSLAKTQEGLQKIQKVIETVQKCVYYHQGSLNKLLMDDKGSTLIVVFGLPPLSHQDDPVRAILTGFALLRELAVINCKCSVGISTGTVYAGVIGTSGSRREYSVLGDSVNLSARLMQMACGETTKKIICCEATAGAAQHKLLMKYYKMVKLKGKEFDLPVYEPIQLSAHQVTATTKVELFSDVKTHQNSLILNESHNEQTMQKVVLQQFQMVGRTEQMKKLMEHSENFLKNTHPRGFIVIRGTYGIGKSLMVRVLLQNIKKVEPKFLKANQPGLSIIVSSLGPMSKTLKVNGMRQVLQQLFVLVATRKNRKADMQLFLELFPMMDVSEENYDLFQQLVGIKPNEWIHNFPPSQKNQVIMEHKQDMERRQITQLSMLLFKHCVDEKAQVAPTRGDMNSQRTSVDSDDEGMSFILGPNVLVLHTMIIVLEDLNLYDTLSFYLLRHVVMHFQKVLFLATVRDQYSELNFISKKNGPQDKDKKLGTVSQDDIFINGIQRIEDAFDQGGYHTIDLQGLKRTPKADELKVLIKQQFNLDGFMQDKPYDQNETPLVLNDGIKFIERKLDDHLIFADNKPWLWKKGIQSIFYQFLYLRTSGNPLAVIYIIKNLLQKNMITISPQDPSMGIIGEVLWRILDNEETITMEAPLSWVQVNGSIVDKLGCLESLLMKTASVIGDIFDIQTLNKIQPFKDQIQIERLIKILADLESQELLETLDVSDYNIFYRFTQPFMREVIYQRMTYNQRRGVHLSVAETIQTMTHPFDQEENRERKRLEFHWTQAEQKWTMDQTPSNLRNDRFSHKAKRSLIVKQIQQILTKSNEPKTIIKQGLLQKKSDKNITWADRFVLMTCKEFKYYYNQDDYLNNKEPLGAMLLKNIFNLMPLNEKQQGNKLYAFQVSASSWIKKAREMPIRKFFFAALSEDILEEWSIFLEFAKAKAIYEDFTASFGRISFPLGLNQDTYDQSIRIEIADPKRLTVSWGQIVVDKNQPSSNMTRRGSRFSKANIPTVIKLQHQKSYEDVSAVSNQMEVANLKNVLKLFIKKSTSLFYAQIFEMCVQSGEDSYRAFGQQVKMHQTNRAIFDIRPLEMAELKLTKKLPSQNDSDSDSPQRSHNDLDDYSPSSNQQQTNFKRRRSSVSPFPLLTIKEEVNIKEEDEIFKEKDTNNNNNKWQSKVQTQSSENYVTETTTNQYDNKYNIAIKPKLVAASIKLPPTIQTISSFQLKSVPTDNILPLKFDAESTYKTPVKFVPQTILLKSQPSPPPKSIADLNKNSELDLNGYAVKDCYSLKGQQFFLQRGDEVLIKKIYEDNDYLKCSFHGMNGILRKLDLSYTLPAGLPYSMRGGVGDAPQESYKVAKKGDVNNVKPFFDQDLVIKEFHY